MSNVDSAVLTRPEKGDGWRGARPLLLVMLMWAIGLGFFVSAGKPPGHLGDLSGPDSYMRMIRVKNLATTGNWYDGRIARSNTPYGETLHWTRPFDLLVLAGALPLRPFFSLDAALHWSGFFISPLLMLLTVLALVWAVRPLGLLSPLDARATSDSARVMPAIAALLLLFQPAIVAYILPGRADHHAFLFLLLILVLGAAFRATADRGDVRAALLFGLFSGLALWASFELIAGIVACQLVLALTWIVQGGGQTDGRQQSRRLAQNIAAAVGMSAVVALGLLLERPLADFFAVEFDRVSIVHLAYGLLSLLCWGLIAAPQYAARYGGFLLQSLQRTIIGRTVLGGASAALAAAILVLLFPKVLAGPTVDVDPRILPIWLNHVAEMQPVLPHDRKTLADFFMWLALLPLALPVLIHQLYVRRGRPEWFAWLALAICMLLVVPVALAHLRFAPYAEILFVIAALAFVRLLLVWTDFAKSTDRSDDPAANGERTTAAGLLSVTLRVLAIFGLITAGPVIGYSLKPTVPATAANDSAGSGAASDAGAAVTNTKKRCLGPDLAAVLNMTASARARPLTVLTHYDFGPEILYRTHHRVIGSPYHRNGDGIFDTYQLFTATDSRKAQALLLQRRIDLILICPASQMATLFNKPGSLYEKLTRGTPPTWASRVKLPAYLAKKYHLFAVTRP